MSMDGKLLIAHELSVRWRDLDAYNHVNNASYLTFLEEARIRWFNSLPQPWRGPEWEPLVARIECSFRAALNHPARIRVSLAAARVGNTSLVVGHQIEDLRDQRLCADGVTVLVWVDPRTQRPRPLPDFVREAAGG